MRRACKRLARALILSALSALPAAAQSVGGHYRVEGINPNGSHYAGTAEITPSGDTCRIVWHVGSEWRGVCMVNSGSFAAAYTSGNTSGLLIYQIQPDGSLIGVWTLAGQPGRGSEVLIPAP
jgi:hypothetical protein